jgi:hypothetical protein
VISLFPKKDRSMFRFARFVSPLVLSLALSGAAGAATPTTSPAASPPAARASAVPYDQAVALVRGGLIAMQQANDTNDYQVLWRLGAPGFQSANPPDKLAAIFANLRTYDLNALLVLTPTFTELPALDAHGMLVLKGYFPIDRNRLNFMLIYQNVGGRWKLFGIGAQMK